jgi:ABC-type lipoprotein export system ATPase subunit
MSGIVIRDLRYQWPVAQGAPGFSVHVRDWCIQRGAAVALCGPSGCGKSTLLNLFSGILSAQQGSLLVHGLELCGASPAARAAYRATQVGHVPQDAALVPWLSVLDNVLLPWRIHPALPRDTTARARARELLGELGVGDRERAHPNELSAGERQRVAVARALVKRPQVLLADELTSALDPAAADTTMALVRRLSAELEATTVVVTHDATVASRLSEVIDVRHIINGPG